MAEPASRKPSFGVVVGWMLTVPGFLMIAGVAADGTGLLRLAGCTFNFTTGAARCAPGVVGSLMNVLQVAALMTYFSVVMLVGIAPLAWSLIFPLVRWQAGRRAPPGGVS